ncbi:MAG: hypothetical protein VYD19_11120 [Myxococcota bacterium]|nr:hypothetical protein [Myxococcota bacterium]
MKRKESTKEALLFAFADRLLSEEPGGRVLSFNGPPALPLELPPPPSKMLLDQLMREENVEFQLSLSSVGTHTLGAPTKSPQEREERAVKREGEQVQRGQSPDEKREEERSRRGRKRRRRGPRKSAEESSINQSVTPSNSSKRSQAPAEGAKGEKREQPNQGTSSKERAGPKRNRRRKRRRNANPKNPSGGSADA